jgi:hypothetical protein
MTDPTNPLHDQGPDDREDPADTELSADAEARLRARLRDEPVDDDDLARERRIRAALEAFAPEASSTQGPVPTPRRRSGRVVLVAAAVLAVVGIGGLFVVSVTRSGGEDSASMESADSAVTTDAAEDRSPAMEAPESSPSNTSADEFGDGSGDAAGSAAPTSTAPLDRSLASTDSVPDLGQHDDVQDLLDALRNGADVGVDTARSNDPAVLPCVAQQRAAGVVVRGVAMMGTELVVVIDAPSGPQLLDPRTCAPR